MNKIAIFRYLKFFENFRMDKEAIKAAKKAAQEEKRRQKKLEQAEKAYERDLKKAFSGQGHIIY